MSDIRRVGVEEAKRLIDEEGYVYLDVRSVPEWSAGHPEGARNVPLLHAAAGRMQPNPHFLEVVQATFDEGAKLVVGCAAGRRSLRAVQMLLDAGFRNVVDLEPGFNGSRDPLGGGFKPGWKGSGLPVVTETEEGSYTELATAAGVPTGGE